MPAQYADYLIRCTLRAHVDSFPLAMHFDFASNSVTPSLEDVTTACNVLKGWAAVTYSARCSEEVQFDSVDGQAMSAPGGYETTLTMTGTAGSGGVATEVLPYAVCMAVGGPFSGYGRHGRKYTFGAGTGHVVNRNQWAPAWREALETDFAQLVSDANTAALPWVICSFTRHLLTPVTVIRAVPEIAVLGRRLKLNS